MDDLDRDFLLDCFSRRARSDGAMEAYWAGRIDGHCLQNAISLNDLAEIAVGGGYRIDWVSALEEQL